MPERIDLRLVWPTEVDEASLLAVWRVLAGTAGTPVRLQALGRGGPVEHRLSVPAERRANIVRQLRAIVPGLGVESAETEPLPKFTVALDIRQSTRRRPLRIDVIGTVSASLLRALAAPRADEVILLTWTLTKRLPARAVPGSVRLPPESLPAAIVSAPFTPGRKPDADTRQALKVKQAEPGWRVIGRLAVRAASDQRARLLAGGVLAALRVAEAPGVHLIGHTISPRSLESGVRSRLVLNLPELVMLSSWPIGDTASLPIVKVGSRRLPASEAIPRNGRVLGESTWPGASRPLVLSPSDGLRHSLFLGPTGVGKSTAMLALIEADMKADRGLLLVDPKSDLARDVLARVPDERRDDVVVIDAGAGNGSDVVGINPLAGTSPDLAADELQGLLRDLSGDHWGPRLDEIVATGMLTLARAGSQSLITLAPLLTDAGFRRRIVGQVQDPYVASFWAGFEGWSDAERTTAVAPVLRRLRPFLIRPGLRRLVGQPSSGFDLADVFTKRRIVIVDLARGQIGEEAAKLLGALVLTRFWRAVQGRSSIPADRRSAVTAYVDEFHDVVHLPLRLEDALAQARGLGVGFVFATQHLKRLTPQLRAAVMANARSKVVFQLQADDAREMARDQALLTPGDFQNLESFHFYSQLVAEAQVQPWCSGHTRPPSEPTTDSLVLRSRSIARYGMAAAQIDQDIAAMLTPPVVVPGTDVGPPETRRVAVIAIALSAHRRCAAVPTTNERPMWFVQVGCGDGLDAGGRSTGHRFAPVAKRRTLAGGTR